MEKEALSPSELLDIWPILSGNDRVAGFLELEHPDEEELFLRLGSHDQAALILSVPLADRRSWMRLLAPDDAADVVQNAPMDEREGLLALLDERTRSEVTALLAYAEDEAGGLMNPRYVRLRADMTADEAIGYLRKEARAYPGTLFYIYVLDAEQRLRGVVSFRELFAAPPDRKVHEIMTHDLVAVSEDADQETLSHILAERRLLALPVVDREGRMKGIVTADDIADVVREEATQDIHKIGGSSALGAPYLQVDFLSMIRKRAGWLSVLFLSEMLTATAMGFYENAIARAVVLALFVPLIISSGGNSGSQATTLVIRAMALGEVRLRDWWRVLARELRVGFALGCILGGIGLCRILLWQAVGHVYGKHYLGIAITVALSLVGVVLWGTISGSMLPFILRGLRFDPASASAPFVATLVDVTGLVIYFTVASVILSNMM